jgi:HK97 family phage major capsid protein
MLAKQISNTPIWICTKSALKKIVGMADALGNSILITGDISKGLPPTLAGFPLFFTFRQQALGTKGDLMLVDPAYYLVKDGSGHFVQTSDALLFKEDQTLIKCTWFIDGEPWVKAPILAEDAVTTVSPYVLLS